MRGCDVSLILVNYNTGAYLERFLTGFFAAPPRVSCEVIVVDNASADDSLRMVSERFPQVRVVANTYNYGFAVANNHGYRVSRGEFVMPVNPDTEIAPGALD